MKAAIAAANARLGAGGRLVIRPSGTEPVIRVMAEAEDRTLVDALVAEVCDAVAEGGRADSPHKRALRLIEFRRGSRQTRLGVGEKREILCVVNNRKEVIQCLIVTRQRVVRAWSIVRALGSRG